MIIEKVPEWFWDYYGIKRSKHKAGRTTKHKPVFRNGKKQGWKRGTK